MHQNKQPVASVWNSSFPEVENRGAYSTHIADSAFAATIRELDASSQYDFRVSSFVQKGERTHAPAFRFNTYIVCFGIYR